MKSHFSANHPDASRPAASRGRPTSWMRLGLALVASASMAFAVVGVTAAAPAFRQTVDVFRVDGAANTGTATLTRTNSGVSMAMNTRVGGELFDLPLNGPPADGLGVSWHVGDATTNWFVVFNNPGACTDPCGEDDVIAAILDIDDGDADMGGPAQVGIHYATGHVAGSSSWHSAGSLREGDTRGMILGLPLMDAMSAEVHLIVRSHGPMATLMPGERGSALMSVDGGCGTNTCGDAQAAVFPPPN